MSGPCPSILFRGWARSEEDLAGEDLEVQAMGSAARASSKLPDSIVACNDDFETCMWRSSVEEAFRGSSRSAIIDHETIVVPAHSERTIVRVSRVFFDPRVSYAADTFLEASQSAPPD